MAYLAEQHLMCVRSATLSNRGDRYGYHQPFLVATPAHSPALVVPLAYSCLTNPTSSHIWQNYLAQSVGSSKLWLDLRLDYHTDSMESSDYKSDAATYTNTREDSGREALDPIFVSALPDG